MADAHETLTPKLRARIEAQHPFFVATAPSGSEGHVNLSPKGMDTFRVLDERTVAYLDLTGSGAETIAHLRQNGRITVMFCAFDGNPEIIRLYGRGHVVTEGDAVFADLEALFPSLPGVRSIITVDLDRVSSSCGYAVPLFEFVGERSRLVEWAEARGPEGIVAYQASQNAISIDGIPALSPPAVESVSMSQELVLAANRAFYDAFEARNLGDMGEVWEHSDRIVCIHPGWSALRGWADVMGSWKGLFEGPQRLQFILTNEVVTVQESIAWVVVDENLLDSGPASTIAAVNVFSFDGTSWRMIIHHGSGVAQ